MARRKDPVLDILTRIENGLKCVYDRVKRLEMITVYQPAQSIETKPCRWCSDGIMRKRKGRFGLFWGCCNYPQCKYTEDAS